jgi:hypothetical protein
LLCITSVNTEDGGAANRKPSGSGRWVGCGHTADTGNGDISAAGRGSAILNLWRVLAFEED